jgi:very-short-patch-repair endonuclease
MGGMNAEPRRPSPHDRLLTDVDAFGRVVRRRFLRGLGHKAQTISAAVSGGALVAAGRLWVALPDAGAHLISAAEHGVVLSCVTAAKRLGLWTFDSPVVHVAAGEHASHRQVAEGTVLHWAKPLVPRHPDSLVDPVENVLALMAACQPYEHALTVWESAQNKGLVDPAALARLPLTRSARRLLHESTRYADSGLETIFRVRLKWLGLRIVPQAWIHGRRVDFLIGDRLVVQIDGGHHVGAQRTADIRHDAELTLRGYHVIRVGYEQVMHDWPGVQLLIMQAVGQGLHLAA